MGYDPREEMGMRANADERGPGAGASPIRTPAVKLAPPKLPSRFLRREPLDVTGTGSKPGIPPDRRCDSSSAMQSHEFTLQFLANEKQLDLDAEARRAHLASGVRAINRPTQRFSLARLAVVVRRLGTTPSGSAGPAESET
jgi:hypothetical protein